MNVLVWRPPLGGGTLLRVVEEVGEAGQLAGVEHELRRLAAVQQQVAQRRAVRLRLHAHRPTHHHLLLLRDGILM